MERLNFENEEKYLEAKNQIALELRSFFSRYRNPAKRAEAKEAEVKVFFKDDEETKEKLLSLLLSDYDNVFLVQKYLELIEPVIRMRSEDPLQFEEKQREVFNLEGGYEPLNKMISYDLDGDNIKLHWAPSKTIPTSEKIHLLKNSLVELEKILIIKKEIKSVVLSSWIVGRNPSFFERFGFRVKDDLKEKIADSFASLAGIDEDIKTAFMSREDFLKQNFAQKFEKNI